MILGRFATAVRQQNWFVALIEVLVVVAGIFIGLQADSWNEARKDRKDEQAFLQRLHSDIDRAEQLSVRVRDRRIDRLDEILSAADVLYERVERRELSQSDCSGIVGITYFNVNVSNLPSVIELVSTGRMHIIRDAELRRALVNLEQTREALRDLINVQSTASRDMPALYPALVQVDGYFDEDIGEARVRMSCDTAAMRANRAFLNDFSVAMDRYDAYVRDGLRPWAVELENVHALVDAALGIRHGAD